MTAIKPAVLIDGRYPATLLYDKPGNPKVLVEAGREAAWVDRGRVSDPAGFLGRGEQPAPANAAYRGVMGGRLGQRR